MLTVGVLAAAGGSTLVVRMLGAAARERRVAGVAAARLETLRSSPCQAIAAGEASADGIAEQWTATDLMRGTIVVAKAVQLTLRYTVSNTNRGGATARERSYHTIIACTSL